MYSVLNFCQLNVMEFIISFWTLEEYEQIMEWKYSGKVPHNLSKCSQLLSISQFDHTLQGLK